LKEASKDFPDHLELEQKFTKANPVCSSGHAERSALRAGLVVPVTCAITEIGQHFGVSWLHFHYQGSLVTLAIAPSRLDAVLLRPTSEEPTECLYRNGDVDSFTIIQLQNQLTAQAKINNTLIQTLQNLGQQMEAFSRTTSSSTATRNYGINTRVSSIAYTRELSSAGLEGATLLSLMAPAHPPHPPEKQQKLRQLNLRLPGHPQLAIDLIQIEETEQMTAKILHGPGMW